VIIKHPATSYLRSYTTLWNTNITAGVDLWRWLVDGALSSGPSARSLMASSRSLNQVSNWSSNAMTSQVTMMTSPGHVTTTPPCGRGLEKRQSLKSEQRRHRLLWFLYHLYSTDHRG